MTLLYVLTAVDAVAFGVGIYAIVKAWPSLGGTRRKDGDER